VAGHTLEVVDMALSLDLDRHVVIYRVDGDTGVLTLSAEKWQQLIDARALCFAGVAKHDT
jgi:hypothetical protein